MDDDISDVSGSFDRGLNYETIKKKLIKRMNKLYEKIQEKYTNIGMKRLVYSVIAIIQLRNGSRISEAVKAFILFIKNGKYRDDFFTILVYK